MSNFIVVLQKSKCQTLKFLFEYLEDGIKPYM